MIIRNLTTQTEYTFPCRIGATHNVTWENNRDLILADGGRIDPGEPAVQEGYTRVCRPRFVDLDGLNGQWVLDVPDRLTSEIEAEQAAAEVIRKATPIVYDQPIEAPFIAVLSQKAKKGVAVTASDDGMLVPVIIHESPWPDKDALAAKIATAINNHKAARAKALSEINGQLQTRLENLERLAGLRS